MTEESDLALSTRFSVHEAICGERYLHLKETMQRSESEAKLTAAKLDAVLTALTKAEGAGWAFNKMAAVVAALATIAIGSLGLWLKLIL